MKIDFNKILIGLDTYTSYVPGLSTVTNLVDLALKALFRGGKEAPASSYRRHIQSKVVKDCALLLIPVIGNILVPALNSPKKRGQYYEKMGDTSKAIEEYTKAPEGDVETHISLVRCYSSRPTDGDVEKGKDAALKAWGILKNVQPKTAEQKSKVASLCMQVADSGFLEEAVKTEAYAKAATLGKEIGTPKAKYEIAILYRDGLGVAKNPPMALQLIQEAANQGYGPAQFDLGYNGPQKIVSFQSYVLC